ncbi:MAG: tetratricopeptide repeat protein [Pseudomonadota bacterium]
MRAILQKLFSPAKVTPPSPVQPARNPARCAELRKRGNALLSQGKLDEAAMAYREAVRADPDDAASLVNLGYVLCEQQKPQEAVLVLGQALERDPDQCDAHFMLSTLALNHGDVAGATFHLREVLRVQPRFDVSAYFSSEDVHDKSAARCEIILSIDPDNAFAHRRLGMKHLLFGDYARGWPGYQWRFKIDVQGQTHKIFPQPLWLGGSLQGKTILLHWEQGYGDTLQFCRYARDVAALGATVLLQVQPGLGRLLAGLDGVSGLFEENEPLPPFDTHCPLMSLPLALAAGDAGKAVPDQRVYLKPNPQRLDYWQQRLATADFPRGPKIGIVWSGNPGHIADLQRSLPLSLFTTALPDDLHVISLQPLVRPADAPLLAADTRIHDWGKEFGDFAETAALVSALDLVITVDTGVAHLAGALGKPVWVLLPHLPDWRWQLDREDTDWYPHVRLFRQQTLDDWRVPLARVRAELDALMAQAPTHAA